MKTSMAHAHSIEERLAHVEKDVADLKTEVDRLGATHNWIDRVTGSFRNDDEFDEILRLGREIRHADRADDSE